MLDTKKSSLFASGEILPNPDLNNSERDKAKKTISRLKLDSPENNRMRAQHFMYYLKRDWSLEFIKNNSPFVYQEIVRQGL